MALIRWSPFRDLVSIQDEMNRLFNDYFSKPLSEGKEGTILWNPTVDISETKDDVVVSAEFPGMKKEDIKISLQDNVLTLMGEKKQDKEEKNKNYHRIERSYGVFQRSFVLPATVQSDKVNANYKDGVLSITLPKAEEAKPKEIEISVE